MKLKHIHIDAYKVFNDFDIDFCHADKILNLIVITGVNVMVKLLYLEM